MKKNYITIIRVLSMLSIIIGHLLSSSNVSYIKSLGQFCYIGVTLFFFISGFLYGQKKLKNNFIINRIKKVFLPEVLFSIIILFIYYFINSINIDIFIKYIVIYMTNIQYFFDYLFGIGHLWFISIIMICYFLTVVLNKLNFKTICISSCVLLSLCVLCLFINQLLSQLLIYILVYILGYIYGNKDADFIDSKYKNIIYFLIVVSSIISRLLLRSVLDDTILYNVGIVSFSNFICAFALFNIAKSIIKDSIHLPKFVSYLDNNSYYIYIVHYIFVIGPLSLMKITNYYVINCIIVIIISMIFSFVYMTFFEKIFNISKKRGGIYGKKYKE